MQAHHVQQQQQQQQGLIGDTPAGMKHLAYRQHLNSMEEGDSFTSTDATRVAGERDVSTDSDSNQEFQQSSKTPASVLRSHSKYRSRTPNPITIYGQNNSPESMSKDLSFTGLRVQGLHIGTPVDAGKVDGKKGRSSDGMDLFVVGKGIQPMDQTPILKKESAYTSPDQLAIRSPLIEASPFNLSVAEDPGSEAEPSDNLSPFKLKAPEVLDFSGMEGPGHKHKITNDNAESASMEDDLGVSRLRDIDGAWHFEEDHEHNKFKRGRRISVSGGVDLFSNLRPDLQIEVPPNPLTMRMPSSGNFTPTGSTDMAFTPTGSLHSPEDTGTGAFFTHVSSDAPPPAPNAGKHRANLELSERVDYTELLQSNVPPLMRCNSALMFDSHYDLVDQIGSGSFGEVWSARHYRTGTLFALKKTKHKYRGVKDKAIHIRELQSVALLPQHPNLVRYYRAWQDAGHFFIVMELCQGGTLGGLLKEAHNVGKRLDVTHIRCLSAGLMRGLEVIHSKGLLHLDLKPDNLFLTEEHGRIKIGDFGLCIQSKDWDEEEGDREYLAEELLRCEASSAADMFAAGLILFQMLGGIIKLPGNGDDWHNLREERVTIADHCEAEGFGMAQIAQEMIRKDPNARPSASQVLATEEFCGVPQSPLLRQLSPMGSTCDAPGMPNYQQVPPTHKWMSRGSFVQSFKSLDVMDVINCSREEEEEEDDEMDED